MTNYRHGFRNVQLESHMVRGKFVTNKDFAAQGWNAASAGVAFDDCPYYATSTAEKHWKAGFRTA